MLFFLSYNHYIKLEPAASRMSTRRQIHAAIKVGIANKYQSPPAIFPLKKSRSKEINKTAAGVNTIGLLAIYILLLCSYLNFIAKSFYSCFLINII